VAGAFDDFPLDFSRPQVRELHALLARTLYQPSDVQMVVLTAGMNPGMVDFAGPARVQWYSVLDQARAQERLPALLGVVGERAPALGRRIEELLDDQPVLEPPTGAPDELSSPKGAGWRGFGAERLVVQGVDTLVGISFLDVGLQRSRSVCRVTSTFTGGTSHGTASLIGPDLLLTNHHVLHDWEDGNRPAHLVEAWFDYELDAAGATRQMSVVHCDEATIAGDREHDWAVVRLAVPAPATAAVLDLTGAQAPSPDDYVFIIQHPDGGPKMVGLSHNLVRHVDEDVLQYWTDTKAGSSGSPVFNDRWQVVGLHHRWVAAPEGEGVAYRNQGRRIERVLEGLRDQQIEVGRADV
jgi:V8-like Glu-specific endopeptidase